MMALFPAEQPGERAHLRRVHSCERAMPGAAPRAPRQSGRRRLPVILLMLFQQWRCPVQRGGRARLAGLGEAAAWCWEHRDNALGMLDR